jgi:hypothetical protein
MFLHAKTECNNLPKPFDLGKMMSIKKAKFLAIHSTRFLEREHTDVQTAGGKALAILLYLFGCQDLKTGKVEKFTDKVSKKYVDPERFLPTLMQLNSQHKSLPPGAGVVWQ